MRLRLLVSEAWRSLVANMSTTIAAMMTVLIGMFLLGVLIGFGSWMLSWSNHVKRELVANVYFNAEGDRGGPATHAEENAVARGLSANPLVKKWHFVSKEAAINQMKKTHAPLISQLPYNPLPDTIIVTPKRAEDLQKLVAGLQQPLPAGVHDIGNDKPDSSRIIHFAHWVEAIFAVAVLILLASASLLIANTIRLSIFSRRREIEVMKLVGATNWFVRGPFMIEGLLCGLGGSLFAVLLLVIGREVALPAIVHNALSTAPDVHALAFSATAGILLLFGLGLGAVGSGLTLRRFLRV
ncbi:MAG TPA: permease-like cell division protein FtsX [Gaiellaceae bacterium]|jgi:cell division transport system permease protein|nr:permease-like cell division protein FtsX [Gaiellaceae bacterium]